MSDTANDLNIDLITSSYLSKESSGSALNDNIAANINNIDAIASELGGNYELANKVQDAVYANISDYGSKSLALQDRGALEATKDFAVNTVGKGLIGGTLSGIGGALGMASAATGSDMLAGSAAAVSGLGNLVKEGSNTLLSKAQTDYDTVSHKKTDSAYNYNKVKRDTKIANGGDPTIAGLGNFLDDVMTAGSHLDMNDLTGATAEGLGNLLGMAATGGVGAVVKGGVMGAAKLGAAKLGATAALEAAQSSKAARILGKVFDAPTRANMMFEAGGGVDNAVEAINSYSDEQLAELSPEFNSLVEQYLQNGASPEEASQQARVDLRNQLIRTNALETGLTGAAIGRLVPGTERGLKSLGGKGLGAGSIAGYVGKAASEGIEEFGQEGSSALIGNINEKALLNKDKDIVEDVGQSAVMGAVGGIGTSAVANARPGSVLKGIYDKGKEAVGKFSGKGDKAEEAKAETSAENERASTTDKTTSSNLQSNLESSEANDAIGSNAVISTEVDKNGNSDDREYDKALHEKAALDRASADEAKKVYEELEAKSNKDPSSVTDDELADAHEKAQTLEQAAQISEQEQNHITLSDDMKQALNSNILQNEDADTRVKNIDNMTAVSAAVQVAKELNSLDENSFGGDKAAYENRLNNLGGILTALENQCKSDIDIHSEDVNGKSEVKLNKKNYVKHTINNLFNHGDTVLDAKARVQGHKFDNNGIDTTDISKILSWTNKDRQTSLDINDENSSDARKLKDVLLNIEGLLSSDANLNTDLSIDENGKPVIDNNKTPRLDRAEKILNEFQKGINNKSLKDTKGLSKKIAYMREILHANREIRRAITHFTDINSSKIAESVYREKLTNLKSTIGYTVKSGKDKNGKDLKTEYRSALPSALTHSRRMMTSLLSSENTELYSMYDSQFKDYALGQWSKLGDLLDLIDKYYKAEKNHKKQNPNANFEGVTGKSGANDSFNITPDTIDQVRQLANILAQECSLTNLIYNSTQLVAKGKSNKLKQTLNTDNSLLYAPDLSHLSGNLSSMSDVTFLSNMAKKYKHISQNRVFNNRTAKMFKRVNAVTKRLNRDMAKADTTIDSNVQAAQENIAKNKAIYTEKLKEIKDNITDKDSLGKYKDAVISYVTTTGEAIPKSLILKSDNNTNPKLKPEIESLSKELSNNVYNSLVQDVTPEVVEELNEDEFDLGLTETPEDNTGSDTFFGIDSNEAKDFFEKEFDLGETEDFDLSDIEDLSEDEVESYSLPSVVESLSRTFGEEKPSVRSNGKMPSPPDRSVVTEPDRRHDIANAAEATINGLFTRDIRSMSSREKEMILDRARKLGIPLPRVIAKKETQNSSNLHVLSNLKVKATSALHSLWRNFNSPKALRDGSAFFIKRTSKLELERVLGQVVYKAYNDGRITKFDSQNYDACCDAIIHRATTLKDNISKSCKDKLADFIKQRQGVNPRIIIAELCRHKALKPLAALCDLDASGNLKLDEDKIEMLAVASAVSLAICATKVNEDPFSTNDLWEHVPSKVKEEQRIKYQNTVNPNDFDAVTGMMFKTLMGISRNANSKDEDTVAVDGIASIALDAIVSADNAPISYEGFPSVYTLIDSSHPDYNPTSPDTPRIKFTKEGLTSFTELVNNGANGFSKATTVQIESIAHSLSPHYENDLIFTGNHKDLDNDLDKALDKVFEDKWKKAEDILHTQGQKLSKEQKAECKSRFKEGWNQNTPMTHLINGLGAENLNRIFFDYDSEEDLKLLTPNLRGKLNVKRQQTVRAINEIELRRQNRISILTREIDKWNDHNIRYNHAFPLNTAQCMEIATELLSKNRNEFIAECQKYNIDPKVIEQHYMFGVTKSLRLQELDVAASPVMDKLVRDAETNITTPSAVNMKDKSGFYWKQALIQGLGLDLWKVNKDSNNWNQASNPVNQLADEAIRLASICEEDGISLVQALEALKNGNVSTDDATKYTKVIKKYLASLKESNVKVEVKDENNVIQKVSLNDIKADQPIILHVLSELPEALSGNNFESSLYIEIDGKSCGPSTRIGRFGYTLSLTDFQLCDRGGWHTSFIGTHEDLQKLPAEIDKYIKSAKTEAEKEALTKYKENIVSGMKTDVYAQQAKKANEYIKDMQSHLTDGGKNNVGSKQLWEAITNVYDAIGINLSDIPRLLLKLIATPLAYGAGPLGAAVGFTHIIQDKIEETLSDFNKHLHKKLNSSTDDFNLNSKQLLTEFGHFKGIDDDQAAYEAGYKFFNSMDIFTNYRAAFSGKTWESYTVTCTKEENSASSSWFRNVMLNLNSDKTVITKSTLSSGTTNLWSAITMANLTSNHYVFINSPISMGATSVYPNSSQRSIFALTNLTACLNLLNGFYTGYAEMASRVANGGSLSKVQERDLFNSPAFVNMSKALGIPCGIDGTSTYFTGSSKRSSNLKGVKGIDELLKTTINGIPYTIKPSMYQWTPLGVACQPGITQGSGDADIIMRLTQQIGDKTFGAMFDGINCFLKDINDLANIIDEAQVKTNHQNLTAQLHVAFNKMGEFINKHTDLLMYNQNGISSNIMRAMISSLINMSEVYLEEINKSNKDDAESILSIITESDANTLKSLYIKLGEIKSDIETGDAGSLLNKAYENTQQVLEIVTKAHFAKTFALTGIPDADGQRELASNPLFTEYKVEPDTGLPMSYLNFDTMSFSTEAGKTKASTNKLGFDADGKFEYVGDDTRKHFYYNPNTQELSYVLPSNKPVGAEEIQTVQEYNACVTDVAKHNLFLKTAREIYEQNTVLPKVKTVSLTSLSLTKAAATPSAFNYTDASSDTLFENTQNSSNINSVLMELSQGIENGMRYRFDDKDKEAYRELKNKLLNRLFNLGLFNYSGKPTKDIQLHEIFAGVDFIDINEVDDTTLKGYGLSDNDINDIRTNKAIDGFSFDNKIFLPAHTIQDLKKTMEDFKGSVSGYTIERALTLIDTITHEYQHVFLGKSLKEVYFSKADDVNKLKGYAQELYKAKREAADKIEYIGKTLSKTYANMCIAYYNYLRHNISIKPDASQSQQELDVYTKKVELLNRYVDFIATTATGIDKNKNLSKVFTEEEIKDLHSIFSSVAQVIKSNKSTSDNAINTKKYDPQTDGFVYDLEKILRETLYKDTNSSEELFSIKYELERGVIGLAQISKAALNASTEKSSSEDNYILAQETIVWGNNSTFLTNLAGNTSLLARLSRTGFANEYNKGNAEYKTNTDVSERVSKEAKAITSNLTIRGRSAMWTFLNSFINTGTRAAKALRDVIYNFINNVMGLRIKKVTDKNGKKTKRKQIAFPNGTKKVELSAGDILGNAFAFFNKKTLVHTQQTGGDVNLHIENASNSGNINASQKKIFETIKNYGDKLANSDKKVDVTLRKAFVDSSITVDRACKACKNAGFLQTNKELNAFKATFTALTFNMGFNTEEGNNLTRLLQKVIKDITPEDFDPTYNPALNQGAYNVSAEAVKKYQFIIQGFNNSNYQYVNPKVAIAMLLTDEALQEKFKNTTLTRESVAKSKNFDSSIEKAIFTALGSVTDSVDRMMSKYPDKISGDVVLASWYEAASNAALDLNSEEYQAGLFTSVLNKADELTSKAVAKLVRKGAGALSKSKIPVLSAVGTYVKEASTYVGNPALGELDTLQGAVKATTVDLNDFIRTTPENALGYLFNNKVTGWLMAPIAGLFREFANQSRGDTNYYIQKKKSRNTTQQLPQHAREQTTKIVKNSVTSIKSSAEWQSATDLFIKSGLYNNTDTASSNYISKEDIEKYLLNDNALDSDIRNTNAGAQSRQLVQALVRYTYEGKIATNMQKKFRPNTYSISKATGDDLKAIQKLYTLESIRYIKDNNPESGKRLYSILKKDSSGKDFNYLTSITRFRFNKDLEKIKKYSSKVDGSHVDPMLNYFEGSIRDLPRSMNHIVAIKDSNDLAKYNQLGYTKINTTSPNGIIYMESPYSMENSFLSGAFSYSLNTGMGINLESCRPINAVGTDDGNALNITSGTEEEPVIPLYNADGTIALGGSVLPNKTIMDRVQKDTNLANLLGEWSGRYLTEEQAANCNRNMLIELKNLKDNASPLDSNNFINILNPKETASLPQHTKKALSMVTSNKQLLLDAKEVFGDENTLYVRKDMLNDVLGMQRASIIDVLNGNTELPKFFTDLTKVLATIAGGPANLAKLEKTLQNLAKYVRNSQVIKSFVVPYANIVANAVQLLMLGVPPQDIIKGMRLKIKECNDYVKILNEVALLRATGLSREGTVSDNEAQAQKLLALTEQMSISPMIKAGEFNSITDDVITRDELDINNPSLGLFNKYSEKVSNMLKDHPNVRALLVDKDSDTYRFLAKATQYGDFIAKSIYYDHLKKTKVNENEALYRATTAFVNYDFMPSRGRDYFESLGLAWYFNYKLRMSKIMLHMMQFNPVRSMIYAYLPLKLWDVTLDTPFKDSSLGRFLGMGPSNMSSIGFDNFFKLKNYIPALNLLDVLHY